MSLKIVAKLGATKSSTATRPALQPVAEPTEARPEQSAPGKKRLAQVKEKAKHVTEKAKHVKAKAKDFIDRRRTLEARRRRIGLAAACIASGLTSIVAVVLKASMEFLDPPSIVWLRFIFAAVFLAAYLIVRRPKSAAIVLRPPLLAVVGAMCLGFNYFGFMKGLAMTAPSNAQVLGQFGPLLLVVLSAFVFKEKIRRKQILGFATALLGFGFFFKDQLTAFSGQPYDYMFGNVWVIAGASSWALYALLGKKLTQRHDPQALNLVTYLVAGLCFFPFVNFGNILNLTLVQWLVILSFGVNTLLTYGALGIAFKYLEANKTSIIITLNPIATILIMQALSYFAVPGIGPENIQWLGYLGAGLVIGGAVIVVS